MDNKNESVITEFILQGFTGNPKMRFILFIILLLVYVIVVIGNLGMVLLISTKPQLHKPMYYFLCNLSITDLCCSSIISPKMLTDLWVEGKTISFGACAAQLCLFTICGDTGDILLAMMAYDRYVAICKPLLYQAIMSKKVCQQMIAVAYCIGLMNSIVYTSSIFRLTFCRSNVINLFFCDIPPLLMISCSDTYISEIAITVVVSFLEIGTVGMIVVSYVYILATILRMRSAESRHKAFSTCASHLTTVGLYHGTILFMYFRPSSGSSTEQDKWASLFYSLGVAMLNPFIYSLRNKEVKDAAIKSLGKIWIFKGNNPRYI